MNKKMCYIFAAGDFSGVFTPVGEHIIIAADAGYHHLEKLGIIPHVLVGDFDTIGSIPNHCDIVRFPAEKDFTDTELAIIEGIKRGCDCFTIYGAIGGKRLEHTLGNLALAASYANKVRDITLTDGSYMVKAIHNSSFEFTGTECGFISVFTISGKAEGVTVSNLKYSLTDGVLDSSNPTLCISNEFICGKKASISVKNGTLLIIWQNNQNNQRGKQ